jgi:hypothetical protein
MPFNNSAVSCNALYCCHGMLSDVALCHTMLVFDVGCWCNPPESHNHNSRQCARVCAEYICKNIICHLSYILCIMYLFYYHIVHIDVHLIQFNFVPFPGIIMAFPRPLGVPWQSPISPSPWPQPALAGKVSSDASARAVACSMSCSHLQCVVATSVQVPD